ncbi:MAG: hypothetical protein MUP98_11315, partial [Candidatus Aminicenantes bacterium]|nr:hypothetical protein [Candidatus Aminicenantes bacterium]
IFFVIYYLHALHIEWSLLIAVFYVFLELCLITAVALFFSCFSTPILSSIFSLAFYLIGHLSWSLETLLAKMAPGVGKFTARILYTLIPDRENFNFKTEIVYHLPIPPQILIYSTIYGIFYTVFVLFLAVLVFRKRDFI